MPFGHMCVCGRDMRCGRHALAITIFLSSTFLLRNSEDQDIDRVWTGLQVMGREWERSLVRERGPIFSLEVRKDRTGDAPGARDMLLVSMVDCSHHRLSQMSVLVLAARCISQGPQLLPGKTQTGT